MPGLNRNCQVCNNEPAVSVACSALGAMSLAYGKRCGAMGLEPVDLVQLVVNDCGGWENVADWLRAYPALAIQTGLSFLMEEI